LARGRDHRRFGLFRGCGLALAAAAGRLGLTLDKTPAGRSVSGKCPAGREGQQSECGNERDRPHRRPPGVATPVRPDTHFWNVEQHGAASMSS
jgi:hypothetical protein